MLSAETPIKQEHPPAYYTVDAVFNRDAAATDTAGIHHYSEDLIKAVVPNRAGNAYIASLSDRLATAEQSARRGKENLVAEDDIVRAYNRLMKKIGAPRSFRASDADLKAFRAGDANESVLPDLLTSNRNGTSCNPGEAVYLLYLLISGNGRIPRSRADLLKVLTRADFQGQLTSSSSSMYDHAQGRLNIYSLQHDPKTTAMLFNEVASTFHF